MMPRQMYILRSVSGAGKSTLAKKLLEAGIVQEYYEADMFHYNVNGEYDWKPENLHRSHQWCYNQVLNAVVRGVSVCVSNTFTTEKELKPYLDLAEQANYDVTCLVVENRHGSSDVHNVPSETKVKQADKLKNSLKLL